MFKIKRIIPALIITALACSSTIIVDADQLQDKLNNYKYQQQVLENKSEYQKQQESAAMQQAKSVQTSLAIVQDSLNQNNMNIDIHTMNIRNLKIKQAQLEALQKDNRELLINYLRTQYEQGDSMYINYIDWVINSKSLSDLISRIEYLESYMNYFDSIKDKINTANIDIKNEQIAEQQEMDKLNVAVADKQQAKDTLQATLDKQQVVINSLSAAEQQTLAQQKKVESEIEETERLIQAQEREAAYASGDQAKRDRAAQEASDAAMQKLIDPVNLNGNVRDLINYAKNYLGLPYVFGGNSPVTGFDCSSFVQHVYGHFGVKLYRVTWDQYTEGIPVSQDELQPGDLVFFQTYASGPSHVGIYIGNRMMIDDSNKGVGFDSLDHKYWKDRYYGARRVIQ